ncbi:MAG: DNA-directed RNA polymerase subunit beta [Chlorobi bacterium OLB7]|nr:MAG: DNA-directed RNA polymerase subunit beta [Chlorobi bacterium OLB7]
MIQSQLFSRRVIKKDTDIRKDEKKRQEMLDRKLIEELDRYSKMLAEKLGLLLDGETSLGIRDESGTTIIRAGTGLKADTFTTKLADGLDVGLWSTEDPWVENKRKNSLVRKAYQKLPRDC